MSRKPSHKEPFRVVVDPFWPREGGDPRSYFYHEHFDSAQARYLKLLIDQVCETRLICRISFERYNEFTGNYHSMFESLVHQTIESHGLDPNK